MTKGAPDAPIAGGFYHARLAEIHAEAYATGFLRAFPWLIDTIQRAYKAPALHDLGCGDGRFMAAAADAGLKVTGSDISPAFIALARGRGQYVVEAPARSAPWPRGTTALTALGEVLAYHDADAPSLWAVAEAAARSLPPDGLIIADLIGPGVTQSRHKHEGPDWTLTAEVARNGDVLTRRITITGAAPVPEILHSQAILDPAFVKDRLGALGFAVQILDDFGPLPLLPGRFGLIARKL